MTNTDKIFDRQGLRDKFRKWDLDTFVLAKALGIAHSTVQGWVYGRRTPRKRFIEEIKRMSDGEITEKDFKAPSRKPKIRKSTNKRVNELLELQKQAKLNK
tara:strand:- start:153 stop:455 length:303 start_codon:yes stop_codon:yes gene_type:complete